jgi:hypothetical protein
MRESPAEPHVDPYVESDHAEFATIELVPVEKFKPEPVLGLRKLWTIEALHFPVNINERIMDCLLDSSSEVNVLPYVTALSQDSDLSLTYEMKPWSISKVPPSQIYARTCPYALEVLKYDCRSS